MMILAYTLFKYLICGLLLVPVYLLFGETEMNSRLKAAIAVLIINTCLSSSAFAYLDAGTGSMILQAILGGAAGVVVIGKMYWKELRGLFSKKSDKKN